MKKVTVVAHPETGHVITPSSNNPEYGTFRVDTVSKSLEGGFVNINKRSAFIRGKIEDLQGLGLKADMKLDGCIKKQEAFEPFYADQEPKINPTTEEVVLTDGRETYLQFEYTADPKALDVWGRNVVDENGKYTFIEGLVSASATVELAQQTLEEQQS